MKVACIYHADCLDGLGAAAGVAATHEQAYFVAAKYGRAIERLVDYDLVLIVDFSVTEEEAAELCKHNREVQTWDHHKGAKDKLVSCANKWSNFSYHYEESMSGAEMVWLGLQQRMPSLVSIIGDRDLWKFKIKDTRAVTQWLFSFEGLTPIVMLQTILSYELNENMRSEAVNMGRLLLERTSADVRSIAKHCFVREIESYECVCCFSPLHHSELGSYLLSAYPYSDVAVIITPDGSPKAKVSVRSTKERALPFAQLMGGGGHPNAAGATMPLEFFIGD